MGSFKHARWRWEPLEDASDELTADAATGSLLGAVGLTADELRRDARSKDETGDTLTLLASRDARAECFVRFDWNTRFIYVGSLFRDEPSAELFEGLATIGAYVRDRTERPVCVDPKRPGSAELTRLFPRARETGYMHVSTGSFEDILFEPGPPITVLDGECSANPLDLAARESLDEMLAEHAFAGFEL